MMADTMLIAPEQPRTGESLRSSLLVILTVLIALAAGWALKTWVERRSIPFATADRSLTLSYPAGWTVRQGDKDALLAVFDSQSGSAFRPSFTAGTGNPPKSGELREASGLAALRRSNALREYRELSSQPATVAGNPAVQVSYAYVTDPPAGAGLAMLPIVVQASDVLLIHDGRLYTFTVAAEAADASIYAPQFERILASIGLK